MKFLGGRNPKSPKIVPFPKALSGIFFQKIAQKASRDRAEIPYPACRPWRCSKKHRGAGFSHRDPFVRYYLVFKFAVLRINAATLPCRSFNEASCAYTICPDS